MKISVEISMYPLLEQYRPPIIDFIDRLSQNPGIEIEYGRMSTFIFGEYQQIMPMLQTEIHTTLKEIPESVFIIKLSGGCH
ncbi:hypothetical protein THMIRHAM_15660 [Thiomicrorhabdus immobilis]|uniref:Thiamin/hydroxymethyl pyrimidine-binding YkoF putative domain-containing protein n=1 Tax=Thiomicrorhabdus immobilis TaxID=2791037 RepID=A0ABM7MEE1_9GAMM|nr:hypothetical protein [Thiomicrorhabdus immobilis]BCN93781.1 hypothetical protein THMIRHAM_15660 [Thiomicrorhabdus immobilis]